MSGPTPVRKTKPSLDRRHERAEAGDYEIVIGIDEAGRGPLCGPVVAAACIVPYLDDLVINGIIDSKKLTDEKEREEIYEQLISDRRVMWCASIVSNSEIDSINILQASLAAMKRATEGLLAKYNLTEFSTYIAMIDGNKIPGEMPVASKCIIKGDGHIYSIAAASIIAKVTRDRIMIELDKKYPIYGLAKHKGYPTAAHRMALYEHGPCDIYRMSYMPVKLAAERQEKLPGNKSGCGVVESNVESSEKNIAGARKRQKKSAEIILRKTKDHVKYVKITASSTKRCAKVIKKFQVISCVRIEVIQVEQNLLRRSLRLKSK